ncbi:hypothetical protein SPD48_09695 [Pseudogracilibacillus sp. SE30717A]|uniref:hypothetical protein n=1 Tax=Pseudogracilibacillus sp. SE30717A TaxID=3098293 RepID=UPI00300E4B97
MIRKDGHITKNTGFMMLDNVADGKCKVCATEHDEKLPHNQESLHYQYVFYDEHGRWPTWEDAMEHCEEDIKVFWKNELNKRGIEI